MIFLPKKYSYSQLNLFASCPLKYKLAYIDKIRKKDEGIESFLGNQVHLTLEWIYKKKLSGRKVILYDEIKNVFDDYWSRNFHENIRSVVFGKSKNHKPESHFISLGWNALNDFSRQYGPYFNEKVIEIEYNFTFVLGGFVFAGIIDRIDEIENNKYTIIDYKTGKKRVSKKNILMDLQMGVYYLAMKDKYPDFKEITLRHHYLKTGEIIENTIIREDDHYKEYDGNLTSNILSQVDSLNNGIESNNFISKESALCHWCYYWKECDKKESANPASYL